MGLFCGYTVIFPDIWGSSADMWGSFAESPTCMQSCIVAVLGYATFRAWESVMSHM